MAVNFFQLFTSNSMGNLATPSPIHSIHFTERCPGGPEKARIRFRTAGSSRFQLRENPGFRFHFFEEKSQLGDCLCCVGGCLPADRPAELWAKIGCLGRLDRKERCKNTKHFFSFAALSRKVCFQETFVGFYIK